MDFLDNEPPNEFTKEKLQKALDFFEEGMYIEFNELEEKYLEPLSTNYKLSKIPNLLFTKDNEAEEWELVNLSKAFITPQRLPKPRGGWENTDLFRKTVREKHATIKNHKGDQ
ncbi:hypothetical protein [Cognatishimia sp.]|uniref:hypothetical protein n=1 Tax=Cognatishimia sp. TaxID=2211648 RepID=UPI003518F574|nr:hypothetical protein [Cognatishimia sp.]